MRAVLAVIIIYMSATCVSASPSRYISHQNRTDLYESNQAFDTSMIPGHLDDQVLIRSLVPFVNTIANSLEDRGIDFGANILLPGRSMPLLQAMIENQWP
jgi:hypothetical protein